MFTKEQMIILRQLIASVQNWQGSREKVRKDIATLDEIDQILIKKLQEEVVQELKKDAPQP